MEAGSESALADGIARILEHYTEFDPARIRRHVEERFSGPPVAEMLKSVYGKALAR